MPQIVDLGDARVAQLSDQRSLVEEHAQQLGVGDQVRVRALDDALASGAAHQEDIRHAAGSDAPSQQRWVKHLLRSAELSVVRPGAA
jgi:hypothetical protein